MSATNLTELAGFFPDAVTQRSSNRVVGVPSLLPGETVEQAVARRAANMVRIKDKLAAKRAAKAV